MGKQAVHNPVGMKVNRLVAWELACARADDLADGGQTERACTDPATAHAARVREQLVWAGPRERRRILALEVAAAYIRHGTCKLPAIAKALRLPYGQVQYLARKIREGAQYGATGSTAVADGTDGRRDGSTDERAATEIRAWVAEHGI